MFSPYHRPKCFNFQSFRFIFLGIYSCECVIRTIAKGFILNNYTYLRNAWNWLDFLVIFSGYLTSFIEMGNLAGLRTFRVLRALKTIAILPSKSVGYCCSCIYHSYLIWRPHFLLLLRENLKLESSLSKQGLLKLK